MAKYSIKLRKNSLGSGYTASIKNDRILSKKETYKHLVENVGGSKADHASAWQWLALAVKKIAAKGCALRVDGLGVFRNKVTGAFLTSKGPYNKGTNMLLTDCYELAEFRNALDGATVVNETGGDNPVIKSILNTAIEEYDVVRVGDILSMAGTDLAPDVSNEDEFVAIYKDGALVAKATIISSALNTVTFKFEGVTLAAGDYRIGIFTRCGDETEGIGVKSAYRSVTVATAA